MRPIPQPRKAPRQQRSQHMVEAILEATARILAERGYAGTNTNLVAARAGVSVGSVYQYFPNKDALLTALHERHARQMHDAVDTVLVAPAGVSLRVQLGAIVRAWLLAHRREPALHRVLEKEFAFFDAPAEDSAADNDIARRMRALLEAYRGEIGIDDLDLATWIVLRMMESLVHAAVLDAPPQFEAAAIEAAIVDALAGYLRLAP